MKFGSLIALLFVSAAAPHLAAAQRNEAQRLVVMNFQSRDRTVGAKAADALRGRLSRDFPQRQFVTVGTKDFERPLEASGFSTMDALAPSDEQALAKLLRADEYITGKANLTAGGGYRIEPQLVLARDNTLVQPLTPAEAPRLEDAVRAISAELKLAITQLPAERDCISRARSNNIQGAVAAAQQGIAAFPRATLPRMCVANVYYSLYAKAATRADSLNYAGQALTAAKDLLSVDSLNVNALRMGVELSKIRHDSAAGRQMLMGLVRANPSDTKLMDQVVNEFAASGHARDAVPMLKDLVQRNSGDPQLLRSAFLVYLAANAWQDAVALGPELIKIEPSAADTTYYIRMAAAYQSLSQPQKALDTFAEGTAKFPNNASLWLLYAQSLRQAGQNEQAVNVLRRAMSINPNIEKGTLQLADAYIRMNMPDSALIALQRAAAPGSPDRQAAARLALQQGNTLFRAANTSKNRAEFQTALKFLQFSNSIESTPTASFLSGAAAFSIMQSAATEANEKKNCDLARLANESYNTAQTGLNAGSHEMQFQTPASQMLQYLPKFRPAIESMIKKFCQ